MPYSQIEQMSRDLDIFFTDSKKIIHLASGGGVLPEKLTNTDEYNELVLSDLIRYNGSAYSDFEIEINPNLQELLQIEENDLNYYLKYFIEMAKHGFYSYDKTKLGNFDDYTFHLVAKPKENRFKRDYKWSLVHSKLEFPEDFNPFNLNNFI
jgi:hypothetical protein